MTLQLDETILKLSTVQPFDGPCSLIFWIAWKCQYCGEKFTNIYQHEKVCKVKCRWEDDGGI